MYALTEDIKKEEVKEEEATETTEEVVEEVSEPSELEEAQARAEEFENKYLRAHAEMQNIQRRANEERQQLQKYRSKDLAKAIRENLYTLGDDVQFIPGHGPTSTIGHERKNNAYVSDK